ncbi:MAG: hypothetical protein H7259_06480 [Cytophagales bacterium]|nr:hypothetical protein [Cytophaga sp.]
MLKTTGILFLLFFTIASCKTGKYKAPISTKEAYTTYEDSDFLYNSESQASLKKQYKLYKKKQKDLSKFQPENTEQNLRKTTRQKGNSSPKTYY